MPSLTTRILKALPFGHHGRTCTPFVALDRSLCKACWCCLAVCPESVLGKVELGSHKHAVVDWGERCTGCGSCLKACKSGALSGRGAPAQ
jgi:NADH dehydrogenase/NADH:ubiquinone oxidoreductase 75 kD subunit (chain G)